MKETDEVAETLHDLNNEASILFFKIRHLVHKVKELDIHSSFKYNYLSSLYKNIILCADNVAAARISIKKAEEVIDV